MHAYTLTPRVALHICATENYTDQFGSRRCVGEEWLVTSDYTESYIPDVTEVRVKIGKGEWREYSALEVVLFDWRSTWWSILLVSNTAKAHTEQHSSTLAHWTDLFSCFSTVMVLQLLLRKITCTCRLPNYSTATMHGLSHCLATYIILNTSLSTQGDAMHCDKLELFSILVM